MNTKKLQQSPCLRFIVEHATMCGWEIAGEITEGNTTRPCSYNTFFEAVKDVVSYFEDIKQEIADGDREEDEGYDPSEFQITDIKKDKCYRFEIQDNTLKVVYPKGLVITANNLLPLNT